MNEYDITYIKKMKRRLDSFTMESVNIPCFNKMNDYYFIEKFMCMLFKI